MSVRALVSHAHADHTRGFKHKGVKQSTPQTRDIHVALNDYRITNFAPLELGEKNILDDMEIVALNAGTC